MIATHSYSLSVEDGQNEYSIPLDGEQEFNKVKELCEDRTNMAGLFKASVACIRTDLESLPQDLFFPVLIHGALKIEHSATRIFIAILCIVWDSATLPIRIITFIPRAAYNYFATQKEHPLISYLKEKEIPEHLQKGLLHLVISNRTVERKEAEPKKVLKNEGQSKQYRLTLTDREAPIYVYERGEHNDLTDRSLPDTKFRSEDYILSHPVWW